MPRVKRESSNTGIYHIMSRALNKQILFDEESDYLQFLKILNDVKKTNHFVIYGYCLMSNHYHLLLREKEIKISKFMNMINSRYANYYNSKYGRTGFVFNDRYHSEPIENMKYFLSCLRYIHQNPVKAMICKNINEYKFSSIHSYKRLQGNYLDLVDTKNVLNKFDKKEFLKWNELDNHDRCLDIINNHISDQEVTKILYDMMKIKTKKEYLQKEKSEIVYYVLKLIDIQIPLQQLSRVTGIYYNKLQKLRIGKEGHVVQLTYRTK